jgi:CO/xanthine dehydrogenase Mo-binding subunit
MDPPSGISKPRDDTVVIRVARSEMGQGTITGLAQLVAEELECDWSKVTIEYPTPGESVKRNRVWGDRPAAAVASGSRTNMCARAGPQRA